MITSERFKIQMFLEEYFLNDDFRKSLFTGVPVYFEWESTSWKMKKDIICSMIRLIQRTIT